MTARVRRWMWGGMCLVLAIALLGTAPQWLPRVKTFTKQTLVSFREGAESTPDEPLAGSMHDDHGADGHDHGDHAGHDHAGHDDASSLELSAQARRNLGLTSEAVQPVTLQTYEKSITIPAAVVERPGRSRVQVATPMTGVVTHVHTVQGEAVQPGSLLFQIRLTHEDLVNAQTDFVRTLGIGRRESRDRSFDEGDPFGSGCGEGVAGA
ncbi:MAG: hypothetical protein R3C05_03535 [Pirellulaceae bacterium]